VTYDGLGDPLGRSQILPYITQLSARGHEFTVISFEKPEHPLNEPGLLGAMRWRPLHFHRGGVTAKLFDLAQGAGRATWICLLNRFDFVHVRSYVPAMILTPAARLAGVPMLFDMRGLWADERVDAGHWPAAGWKHRVAKAAERRLLHGASAITVLTNSCRRMLRATYGTDLVAPIRVIPTCADLSHFTRDVAPDPVIAARLGGAAALVYAGSLGGLRYRPEDMARFYLHWRRVAAERGRTACRFLIMSRDPLDTIRRVLDGAGAGDEIVSCFARREEMPLFLRCATAGIFLNTPSPSSVAIAPTKVGEMLALGLPVVGNDVGDMGEALRGSGAGAIIDQFTDEAMARAAVDLWRASDDPMTPQIARRLAEQWFSLERGTECYDRLYREIGRAGPVASAGDLAWPPTAADGKEAA
jgi:glycosyltransferase involved in cell wall biosynthesis